MGGSKGGTVRTMGEMALSGRRESMEWGMGGDNLQKVHSFSRGRECVEGNQSSLASVTLAPLNQVGTRWNHGLRL